MSPVSQDAPTHYEVLEVSFDASEEEIRRAYRQACHRHHPDRNLGDTDAATSQFQLISEAYFTLSDCTRRTEYDRQLRRSQEETAHMNAQQDPPAMHTPHGGPTAWGFPFGVPMMFTTPVFHFATSGPFGNFASPQFHSAHSQTRRQNHTHARSYQPYGGRHHPLHQDPFAMAQEMHRQHLQQAMEQMSNARARADRTARTAHQEAILRFQQLRNQNELLGAQFSQQHSTGGYSQARDFATGAARANGIAELQQMMRTRQQQFVYLQQQQQQQRQQRQQQAQNTQQQPVQGDSQTRQFSTTTVRPDGATEVRTESHGQNGSSYTYVFTRKL